MINIGPYTLSSNVLLAPMAGITDQPFREIVHRMGAGLCVSEMMASKANLRASKKSRERQPLSTQAGIRDVQLVGIEPDVMAEAAQYYVGLGAQIIDINMGCPAKKVCKKAAGSAILKDPTLVQDICEAVVNAVDVPVTLKIRTGWCPDTKNTVEVARIAQDSGIQMLVIHGRTRACRFKGEAEYASIAAAKQAINIPVIANGDITSPQKAKKVLEQTRADGVMIGRAAQGNPWLIPAIDHYLKAGQLLATPTPTEILCTMREQIHACAHHYGDFLGPRIARKHAAEYFNIWFNHARELRKAFNALENCQQQIHFLNTLESQALFHQAPGIAA